MPRRAQLALALVGQLLAILPAFAADPPSRPAPITLTISYANEAPARILVIDGGMATYRSYVYEESFGVIPTIRNPESGEFEVQFVTITGKRPPYHPGRVLETRLGRLGAEVSTSLHGKVTVTVQVEESADAPFSDRAPCSLSCSSAEITGLSVSSPCGSC